MFATNVPLREGDSIDFISNGGGGYGNALEREPEVSERGDRRLPVDRGGARALRRRDRGARSRRPRLSDRRARDRGLRRELADRQLPVGYGPGEVHPDGKRTGELLAEGMRQQLALRFTDAYIPVGGAWSSPFCRWQGALSAISSLELAVDVTRRALAERAIVAEDLTDIVLGWTVPQPGGFYGAPTLAARIGAPAVSGPMVAQACATSAASVALAATDAGGPARAHPGRPHRPHEQRAPPRVALPRRPGGAPHVEDWVLENFRRDPWAGEAMVATAEAVAAREVSPASRSTRSRCCGMSSTRVRSRTTARFSDAIWWRPGAHGRRGETIRSTRTSACIRPRPMAFAS